MFVKPKTSKLSVCLAILLLAVVSVGPSAFALDEIAFIIRARSNPYWNSVIEGIRESSKLNNVEPLIYQTATDSSSEEQLDNCYIAIERKPKLLAITAVNSIIGIQCLKKAASQGILTAVMDSTIPVEDIERAGLKVSFTIGSDNFRIGEEGAKYAAGLKLDAPEVLILEGAVGSDPGKKRVEGFRTKFLELVPEAKIAASISADWERLKALNITKDILERIPGLDLIFAANDQMALGAVEAVRLHGKSKTITVKIIGVDGTADARKAVLEGKLDATVAQLPYLIGKRSLELAVISINNNGSMIRETTATPVFTKQALEKNTDPNLIYVR